MISLDLLQNIYEFDRTSRDLMAINLQQIEYHYCYDRQNKLCMRFNPYTRHYQTFYLGVMHQEFSLSPSTFSPQHPADIYRAHYHGKFTEYYPNGNIRKILNYDNGVLHGDVRYFFENGTLFMTGEYEKGKREGLFVSYHKGGQEIREAVFYHKDKRYIKKHSNYKDNLPTKADTRGLQS
jgi:hypothetical protein